MYLGYGVRSLGNGKMITNELLPFSIILTMHAWYRGFWRLVSLFVRNLPHTGVSQETRKDNTCTGLCMKDLCVILPDSFIISFRFDNQIVRQGGKANLQLDLIDFFFFITDRRRQQRFCAHYGQIEDKVWFLLSSYSSPLKTGSKCKMLVCRLWYSYPLPFVLYGTMVIYRTFT